MKVSLSLFGVFLCAVFAIVAFAPNDTTDGGLNMYATVNETFELDELPNIAGRDVVILSDLSCVDESLLDSNVRLESTFESVGSRNIVVIEDSWATSKASSYVNTNVRTLVNDGSPVISLAVSPEALLSSNTGRSSSFAETDDVKCMYYDDVNNITYCYAANGKDTNDSLRLAYEWAERVVGPAIVSDNLELTSIGTSWTDKTIIEYSEHCENFGTLNVMTFYSLLSETDSSRNYILTEY